MTWTLTRMSRSNRINDLAYAEKVAQMRERLLTWYQETADWVPNRKDMR